MMTYNIDCLTDNSPYASNINNTTIGTTETDDEI